MEQIVVDGDEVKRALARIAHEILEKNKGTESVVLVGIRSRGVDIAGRLVSKIEELAGAVVPCGIIDITLYRDDLHRTGPQPTVMETNIPFAIDDMHVVLIDDVLYTGRTVRVAMCALMDFGRPQSVQLAVLIDRGHRELPIKADYVGKNLPTSHLESIQVRLAEPDGRDEVALVKAKE